MVQDITPTNSQSATNTNTMKPKDISAQSAGSITPTIVSQSNADRRRRNAAEKAARSNQSLAANVERSEIEKEYRRLREEERKINERAEARKKQVESERVWYYEGGYTSPLRRIETTLGKYMKTTLSGAQKPLDAPTEYANYISINNSGNTDNLNAGYEGLKKLTEHINSLLKTEAQELTKIEGARRSIAVLQGFSASNSATTYTPMTAESVAAHERLIRDPATDAETRSRLMADLDRDSQYVASHGGASLTATTEKNFSENWYRGGTKQEKEIAQRYLGAVWSTYGKEDFNKSADSIYASQAGKQRDALYQRWDTASRNELLKATDERTKAAIRTNMSVAGLGISSIDAARQKAVSAGDQSSSFAPYAAEKQRQQNAAESRFKSENTKIQQKIADTQKSFNKVNSILRVVDEKTDLSSSAFLKEQRKTESVYGSDWTSAGGMSAIDAVIRGDKSTTYSDFKAVPAFATEEYILVDAEGKKRYTLRKGDDGGSYAIYSWSGDIVASGKNSKGLKAAFKELNIPYEEQFFNPFKPELSAVAVELSDETDITGINTAAVLKSKTLGTFRGNEEVKAAEVERRTAIQKAQQNEDVKETSGKISGIISSDKSSLQMSMNSLPVMLAGASFITRPIVPFALAAGATMEMVRNPPKTIIDEFKAEEDLQKRTDKLNSLVYGNADSKGKPDDSLYGSAKSFADEIDNLVKRGELVGSKQKQAILEDPENPDKSVYTYTDLMWTDKATEESINKFKETEKKLNDISVSYSEELKAFNEKVAEKEKLSREIYYGIPQAAKELTAKYLPESKEIYPYINIAEYVSPFSTRQLSDSIYETIEGNRKNHLSPDYWSDKIYNSKPQISLSFDYEGLRKDPVGYGGEFALWAAITGGGGLAISQAAKGAKKVITPLANSELVKKSEAYVSTALKNVPNTPIGIQYSKTKLADGTIKSISVVRRTKGMERAYPLVSKLNAATIGNGIYFGNPGINPTNLLRTSKGKVLQGVSLDNSNQVAIAKGVLREVGENESIKRLDLVLDITQQIQAADIITMQSIKPHVKDVLRSKKAAINNIDRVTDEIVRTMDQQSAFIKSSLNQYGISKELNMGGLPNNRRPADIDVFVDDPRRFGKTIMNRVNQATGKRTVYLKNDKVLLSKDNSELFDIHKTGTFGTSDKQYAFGATADSGYKINGTEIIADSLNHQIVRKFNGVLNFTTKKTFPGSSVYGAGGAGGDKYLMPRKAEREKDLYDAVYGGWDLAKQMTLNPSSKKAGFKLEKTVDEFVNTYGPMDAARIKANYLRDRKGVSQIRNLNKPIPATATESYQNPTVEKIAKWANKNLTVDNLIGTPAGIALTASYGASVAGRLATDESTPNQIVAHEVVPMVVGSYISGKGIAAASKGLFFAKRGNYVPIENLARESIIKDKVKFPTYNYTGTKRNTDRFVKNFNVGGESFEGLKAMKIDTNAKSAYIRAMSKPPEEIAPNIFEVRASEYDSEKFSASAAYTLSENFLRLKPLPEKKIEKTFSMNVIPQKPDIPQALYILSTKEVARVPHGMGIKQTEKYIEKNVARDQYAAVSAKTAKSAKGKFEIEATIQSGAKMQTLSKRYYSQDKGKKIAVDIVGIVPTGAKETDVVIVENNARSIFRPLGEAGMLFPPKASVNKLSVTEKTAKEPKTNKSDVRITKGKDINVIKGIQLKSPKNTGKTKTSLKKDYSENTKKVKAVYITRGITQRGEAGNPFTASPATNYTNVESSEKKKKGISIRSPKLESKKTLVKQKNRDFSKKITIGSPTKSPVSRISSTSRSYSQSLTKPSESFSRVSSPSKAISSISSVSVSKSSSASKSSSSSKSMSKSSSKSGSSSRSVSKSTSRSGSSGRSGSSSSLPKATPTIRSQRRFKANGIILPKNKDRKEEDLLKMYSKENVEIPIVRGEEALSGKKLKKFELPANKKTVLQINNKIYVQKPQKAKKAKKQQKKKNKF